MTNRFWRRYRCWSTRILVSRWQDILCTIGRLSYCLLPNPTKRQHMQRYTALKAGLANRMGRSMMKRPKNGNLCPPKRARSAVTSPAESRWVRLKSSRFISQNYVVDAACNCYWSSPDRLAGWLAGWLIGQFTPSTAFVTQTFCSLPSSTRLTIVDRLWR